MKAIEILYNLSPYQNLLEELYEKIPKEKPHLIWTKVLKSEYNFITLEIKQVSKEEAYAQLAIQITFEVQSDKVVLTKVYTEEESRKEELKKTIQSNKALHDAQWHTEPNNTWYHDEKTTAYIYIADEIAKAASGCSAGDNYHPGHFSEIRIEATEIILSQVNLHNAKSIDHKDNYHMRKLHFYIPLVKEKRKVNSLEDNYQIGEMSISFSDHSSPVNRSCGERIVEQILQQKSNFEK